MIFTSATTGFHLDQLLEAVRYVAAQLQQKVPTAILNRTLQDAVERRQPISSLGHRLKFYYATQVRQSPPTFLLFVNRGELFSDAYFKYLGGELRKAFGYEGCPIILVPKARPKTIEPVRKFNPGRKPVPARGGQRSGEKSERTSSRPEGGKPKFKSAFSPAGGPKPGPSRGGKGGRNEKPRRRSGKGRAAARGLRK